MQGKKLGSIQGLRGLNSDSTTRNSLEVKDVKLDIQEVTNESTYGSEYSRVAEYNRLRTQTICGGFGMRHCHDENIKTPVVYKYIRRHLLLEMGSRGESWWLAHRKHQH